MLSNSFPAFINESGAIDTNAVESATFEELEIWFATRLLEKREPSHAFDPEAAVSPHLVFTQNFSLFSEKAKAIFRTAGLNSLRNATEDTESKWRENETIFSLFMFLCTAFKGYRGGERAQMIQYLDSLANDSDNRRDIINLSLYTMVAIREQRHSEYWNCVLDHCDTNEDRIATLGLITAGILQAGFEPFLKWLARHCQTHGDYKMEWEAAIRISLNANSYQIIQEVIFETLTEELQQYRRELPTSVYDDVLHDIREWFGISARPVAPPPIRIAIPHGSWRKPMAAVQPLAFVH